MKTLCADLAGSVVICLTKWDRSVRGYCRSCLRAEPDATGRARKTGDRLYGPARQRLYLLGASSRVKAYWPAPYRRTRAAHPWGRLSGTRCELDCRRSRRFYTRSWTTWARIARPTCCCPCSRIRAGRWCCRPGIAQALSQPDRAVENPALPRVVGSALRGPGRRSSMRSAARPSTGMHTAMRLSGANAVGIGRAARPASPCCRGQVVASRMHH